MLVSCSVMSTHAVPTLCDAGGAPAKATRPAARVGPLLHPASSRLLAKPSQAKNHDTDRARAGIFREGNSICEQTDAWEV